MGHIFISYATPDRAFTLALARHLQQLGYVVWIDQGIIGVGDSTWSTIADGLAQAAFVIVVISRHTMQSAWVEHELQLTLCDELAQKRTIILPAVIEDCAIPPFLRSRRFADFRVAFDEGITALTSTLQRYPHLLPLPACDIASDSNATPLHHPEICYTRAMIPRAPKLSEFSIEIGLPYIGKIAGVWKPDENERRAAWELYVELITRISVAGLPPDQGLLRESLSSLYVIFTTTRTVLHKYGPAIARPKAEGDLSFGFLALNILNYVLRPLLTAWHPLLLDYEHTRGAAISEFEHEQRWERADELRQVLHDTQRILVTYANILALVANVPPLYEPEINAHV